MECPFHARNEGGPGCCPLSTNRPPLEVGTIPGKQSWDRPTDEPIHAEGLQRRADRVSFRAHTRRERLPPKKQSAFAQKNPVFGPVFPRYQSPGGNSSFLGPQTAQDHAEPSGAAFCTGEQTNRPHSATASHCVGRSICVKPMVLMVRSIGVR